MRPVPGSNVVPLFSLTIQCKQSKSGMRRHFVTPLSQIGKNGAGTDVCVTGTCWHGRTGVWHIEYWHCSSRDQLQVECHCPWCIRSAHLPASHPFPQGSSGFLNSQKKNSSLRFVQFKVRKWLLSSIFFLACHLKFSLLTYDVFNKIRSWLFTES